MKASNQLTILNIEEQTYEDICIHDTTTGLIECTHAQDQGCVRITEIQGKSEQVQSTLGKNLLDITKYGDVKMRTSWTAEGITATFNSDNSLTCIGKYTGSQPTYIFTYFTDNLLPLLKVGETYYASEPCAIIYKDGSANYTGRFTVTDTIAMIKMYYQLPINPTLPKTYYPMICLNSQSTAYEPFIPNSPSPDYPSTINSVGDSGKLNVVSSVGRRNLIKNSSEFMLKPTWLGTTKGTAAEVDEPMSPYGKAVKITITGAGTGFYHMGGLMPIDKMTVGKIYTWSLFLKSDSITSINTIGHESGGMTTLSISSVWKKYSFTYKMTASSLNAFVIYPNFAIGDTLYIHSFKLEECGEYSDWSPAPEDITPENSKQYEDKLSLATVNLASPLRSAPNGIHDVLECKDGVWGVTRNISTNPITFPPNGEVKEYTRIGSDSVRRYWINNNYIPDNTDKICLLSDNYSADTWNHLVNGSNASKNPYAICGWNHSGNARFDVLVPESVLTTKDAAGLTAYLTANPPTFYAQLKTPTWEPLDDPSQKALNNLLSYSGKDYIYTTDPLGTNFSVSVKSRAFYENFKLQEEIKNTNTSLGDLDDEIKGGFYDGVINVNEAEAIRKAAETMHTQVTNQFNKVDSNPSLTGEPKTTHQTKYTECNNAYNTLISKINTAIDYCSVNSTKTEAQKKTAVTDMNTAFGTYKTKLADYQKAYQDAIDAIAKKKADDAVDGMQFSSRNLVLTSGGYKTGQTTKWFIDTPSNWGLTVNDGYVRFTKKNNEVGSWIRLPLSKSLESGKNYILKLRIRTSEIRNAPIHLVTTPGNGAYVIGTIYTTANTWKTMTFSFKAATDIGNQLMLTSTHFPTVNETLDFEYLMLVEGDKVGDWTPAPEDADEKINQVSATLTSTIGDVKTIVDKNTKSITDKVWKSDIITGIKDLNVGGINLWDLSAIKRYASGGLNTIVAGTAVDAKTGKITVTANPQDIIGCKVDVSLLTRNTNNVGELLITGYFDRPDTDSTKLQGLKLYYKCFNASNAEVQASTGKDLPVETSSNLFAGTLSIPANTAYIHLGIGQHPYVKPYTLTGVTVKDSALYDITKGLRDQVSQAYQDINGFKQTVSDTYTTKTEFDQLSIGGRNLAVNDGVRTGGGNTIFDKSKYLESGTIVFDRRAIANGGIMLDHADIYEPSTKYVLRFKAKLNSGSITNIYFHNGQGLLNASIYIDGVKQVKGLSIAIDCNFSDKNYHEIIVYFTTPATLKDFTQADNSTYWQPMKEDASATYNVTITELKIEKGTKFTDWTPPVEDVNAAIEKVDGKFTNYSTTSEMNSKIDQTKSDIELGVSRTYTSKAEGDKITQGLNKWILEVYQLTSSSMPNPRVADIENIRGKVPAKIIEVADSSMSATLNAGDYYIGHAFTYLYFDAAYTWSGTIKTDDEGVVYLNGVKKVSTATSVATNITLPFQAGWNVLEVVYNEGTSNDGWLFSSKLSTLSQCKIMNCYAQVSLNASALIKVTADAINSKVENNSAYSEVVQNAGKMAWLVSSQSSDASLVLTDKALTAVAENINLTGKVTFSSLATDAKKKIEEAKQAGTDAQESLNNLTIGGRNLLKNSRIRKELTKDSNYVLYNFYLVDGIELQTLVNQDLTLSFYVKTIGNGQTAGTGGTNNRFGIHGSAEWENESGGTRTEYPLCHFDNFGITGKRVSLTQKLTPPAGYTKLIYLSFAHQLTRKPAADNNETWVFENPKLEMGSKATDYTEADEDITASISALGEDLQDQIDGKIESYNQTTNPADAWTTAAIKTQHTGDIWYDDSSKLTQRWSGSAWLPLKDADALAAQELAKQKRRVFTATPTTPYDVGDLWVQGGTGDIMKCKTALASGSYNATHWEKASKYTDDTTANQAVSNTVLTPADKISLYATFLSIQNEYSRLKEQCTNLGVADTLKTSYDALYALLNGIVGTTTLQNSITTGFNKSNYDTLYKNYVTARETLEQAQITKVYAYTKEVKETFTVEKALAVANWFAQQDKTMIDGAYIYTGTVTAKQIAANSIDTDRLAVGINPNLVRYGLDTMEQFSTVPYFSKSATATVTLDDSQYYIGTKSIKFIGTSDSNSVCLGSKETDYGCVPVTSGKTYILSCYVKTTSTSNVNAFLGFVAHPDISASNIINHGNASKTLKNTDGWVRLSIKYTASSAYPYASIRINVESPSYPVWFDAFQIEEVDSEDKEPGTFKQAGTTTIDGGNITTGIVKSANYNYSSGNFTIAGTMIDLATGVIRSKGFGMDASGNSYFNGTVTATTLTATANGNIAGWNINSYCLYRTSFTWGNSTGMYFGSSGISVRDKFKVDASGNLTATSATINGNITASTLTANTGGSIAGWKIDSSCLWKGSSTIGLTGDSNIYLGDKGVSFSNKFIYRTSTGELELNGKINSNAGKIGTLELSSEGMMGLFTIGNKNQGYVCKFGQWDYVSPDAPPVVGRNNTYIMLVQPAGTLNPDGTVNVGTVEAPDFSISSTGGLFARGATINNLGVQNLEVTKITSNTIYNSSWYRSTGQTGWYSEDYKGGWYMTDSTWVRTYNNKYVMSAGYATESADIIRGAAGNYGFILRQDGNGTHLLVTNSGDKWGSFNNLRPLSFENKSGNVTMSHSVAIGGNLSVNTINASADLNINVYNKGVIISRQDATSGAYFMSKAMYDRTYTGQSDLCITSLGTVGRRTSSSMRYKTNISYLTNQDLSTVTDKRRLNLFRSRNSINLDAVLKIPIASYSYVDGYVTGGDYEGEPIPGFIAEDIANIFPEAAIYKMQYIDTLTNDIYDYDQLVELDESRNQVYSDIISRKKQQWLDFYKETDIPDDILQTINAQSIEETNKTHPDIMSRCKEQRDLAHPEKWNPDIMIPAILYIEQKHDKELREKDAIIEYIMNRLDVLEKKITDFNS